MAAEHSQGNVALVASGRTNAEQHPPKCATWQVETPDVGDGQQGAPAFVTTSLPRLAQLGQQQLSGKNMMETKHTAYNTDKMNGAEPTIIS
jgi:hypothetical protein